MSLKTRKQLITSTKCIGMKNGVPRFNPANYIIVHETGNYEDSASAGGHANYLSGLSKKYNSWHWTVDAIEAVQSYAHDRVCWHAGDGLGIGNAQGIGVEICVNKDIKESIINGARLVAKLMHEEGIPLSRVIQHNNRSSFGKNCPENIRGGKQGIDWQDFLALVVKFYRTPDADEVVPSKPSKPSKPSGGKHGTLADLDVDGFFGGDTIYWGQKAFGTPADGEVWAQNVLWKDDNPGLTTGWMWVSPEDAKSSPFIEALQRWAGLKGDDVDGLIGPDTIKAVQRKLTKLGLYKGKIDGEFWKRSASVKAFQTALKKGLVK